VARRPIWRGSSGAFAPAARLWARRKCPRSSTSSIGPCGARGRASHVTHGKPRPTGVRQASRPQCRSLGQGLGRSAVPHPRRRKPRTGLIATLAPAGATRWEKAGDPAARLDAAPARHPDGVPRAKPPGWAPIQGAIRWRRGARTRIRLGAARLTARIGSRLERRRSAQGPQPPWPGGAWPGQGDDGGSPGLRSQWVIGCTSTPARVHATAGVAEAKFTKTSRCLMPRLVGAILAWNWKDALWGEFAARAPRPFSLSELYCSDRRLRPPCQQE
jgi:hypothetical protein